MPPEPREYRLDPTGPQDKRLPLYLASILLIFVVPVLALGKLLFKGASMKCVGLGVALVTVICWAWSINNTMHHWWVFPRKFLLGLWITPHFPLEEMLFYPTGMFIGIGVYHFLSHRRPSAMANPWPWRLFLYAVTALFITLGVFYRHEKPYYLYGQLVVFNVTAIVAYELVWRLINPWSLGLLTALLFVLGTGWNYIAFKYEWWIYNAIVGVKIWKIPIEDFNFCLISPSMGIPFYLLVLKHLKPPP